MAHGVGQSLTAWLRLTLWRLPGVCCEDLRLSVKASATVGVGHEEDPIPNVRGTNEGRGDAIPLCIVPDRGQIPENSFKSPVSERWNVLHEDVTGSYLTDDSSVVRPESASGSSDSSPSSCPGNILARESTSENVDSGGVGDTGNVAEVRDVRPVLGEDAGSVGIDLGEPSGTEPASPFKSKVDSPDSAEEASDTQHPPTSMATTQ